MTDEEYKNCRVILFVVVGLWLFMKFDLVHHGRYQLTKFKMIVNILTLALTGFLGGFFKDGETGELLIGILILLSDCEFAFQVIYDIVDILKCNDDDKEKKKKK